MENNKYTHTVYGRTCIIVEVYGLSEDEDVVNKAGLFDKLNYMISQVSLSSALYHYNSRELIMAGCCNGRV